MINRDSPSISNGVSGFELDWVAGRKYNSFFSYGKARRYFSIHIHQSLWVLRHSININSIEWVIGFYLDTFILFSLTSSQEQNIIRRPPIVFIETIKEMVRIRSKQNGKEIGYGLVVIYYSSISFYLT